MLCSWGADVRGGFGLVKPASVTNTKWGISFFSPKPRIKKVSVGGSFIGFIREDGSVTVVKLQGDGKPNNLNLKKQKIKLMACGEANAVLVAYGGNMLVMDRSLVCRPIPSLSSRNVMQIACGNQHSMALTHDGQLFTWGENSSGQLGLGRGEPLPCPQPLKFLSGVPLAQISAGGDHSFALSLSGAVFGWGKNSSGQLGLGDRDDRYIPTCVRSLSHKQTLFISCGGEHTATLSKGGTVFTFGSGCYGQLGHNSFKDELRPHVVSELWGLKVSQISCGRQHTLAMVGEGKEIYSFGYAQQRKQRNKMENNQPVPLPVRLPSEANNGYAVDSISAGGTLSFALCTLKKSEKENLSQRRGILTLEEKMIARWLSTCESNEWKAVKKEIKTVFSSAACLNGSFLKQSCDGHFQTSTNFCGLDLESVRTAMERIAEKEKVLLQVKKVVEEHLIPSLGSTVAGVEAVRVYLVLPELFRVLKDWHCVPQLTSALASAIIKLNPSVFQILENYWLELPASFLKNVVNLFHDASANTLSHRIHHTQEQFFDEMLWKSLHVLQRLYKVSCCKQHEISASDFIIHEINYLFEVMHTIEEDLNNQLPFSYTETYFNLLAVKEHHMHTLNHLALAPCTFNLEAKCSFLKFRRTSNCFRLVLRRQELVEDCFSQLKGASEYALRGWLQVMYSEKFEQTDVNKKDFFDKVFQALRSPTSGMFMYNDTKTLIWFPAEPSLDEERYFLFGILCGLVFYNNSIVYLPFPLALFKKLLDIEPSLEDLTELSPVLGKSLQYILDYSDDDVDNMCMSYRIVWNNKEVELDPNEPDKCVTSANKKEFVDAYVDYVLNTSVERLFKQFKRGFFKVCQPDIVKFFQPEELRGVMVGTEEYDWNALKENATYEELFSASHSTIVSFWKVFDELSEDDKKRFLLFLTGFDRVPILGMNQVKMRVRPLYNGTQDHLPQALTCHAILNLPMYQTKKTLKAKLIEALHHRRGFWED